MPSIKAFCVLVLLSAHFAGANDNIRNNRMGSSIWIRNKKHRLLKKQDDLRIEPTHSPTTINPTTPSPSISPTTLSEFCTNDKRKDFKICREWFELNKSQFPSRAPSESPSRTPSGAPSLYWSELSSNSPTENSRSTSLRRSTLPTAYPTQVVTHSSTETEYTDTVQDSSSNNTPSTVIFVPIGYFDMCLTIRSRLKRLLFSTRQYMNENASYEPRELELAAARRHLYATYKEAFQEPVVSLEIHFVPEGDSEVSGNVIRNSTFYGSVGFLVLDGEDGPTYTEVDAVTTSAFEGAKKEHFLKEFHGLLFGDFDSLKASSLYDVSISASTMPGEIDSLKTSSPVQSPVTSQYQGGIEGIEKSYNSSPTLIAGATVGGLVFVVVFFGFAMLVKHKYRESNRPTLREIAHETNNFKFHSENSRNNSSQTPRSVLGPFNKEKSNFEEIFDDSSIISESIASSTIESLEQRCRESSSMEYYPIHCEKLFPEIKHAHDLDLVEDNDQVEVVSSINNMSQSESIRNESQRHIYHGPYAGNDFLSIESESDGSSYYNEKNNLVTEYSKNFDSGDATNCVEQNTPSDMLYDERRTNFWNGDGDNIVKEIKDILRQR